MTWIRTVPIGDCHERNFHLRTGSVTLAVKCSTVYVELRIDKTISALGKLNSCRIMTWIRIVPIGDCTS